MPPTVSVSADSNDLKVACFVRVLEVLILRGLQMA